MYKELTICSIVIILVISLNIITQNNTNASVDFLNSKLEELKQDLKQEEPNKEDLQKKMDSAFENWREKYNNMAFYIEHDELEKVETELTSLKAHIDEEEYEEGVAELDKSIFILNHIKEKFKLNIKNVF